ncbi:23121_t:CDS:2, partial [Gigaspora margarita]
IAKETFSRKLVLILSEIGTIDYRNKKIEQQILVFLNSIEEEGQSNIEEAERNTIKQESELKKKEVIKEEKEEKQHTVNEILKEAQGAKSVKNKDTKKVKQEDRLEPKDKKVYFTIWGLPNRISKKATEVEWSPIKEDIKKKLEANWVLPLRDDQLARIIAGRKELAQKLVKEIKEKLIWEFSNSMKIEAGYPNAPKLGITVVTKNIAIESGFSSMTKKDKEKESRVMK